MKKGIIFDMDGTLWDSSENVAESWDKTVREKADGLRRITTEDMQNVMGHTMTEIAEAFFPMLELKDAVALADLCGEEENEYLRRYGGVLYPGLEAVLGKLAETYPLYIVSNCQKGYIEAFLEYYQFWDYFKDFECFGNNKMDKAQNIALIMERNYLERAVYIGDIQGDYDSSRKAGADFIHASYGYGTIDREVPFIRTLSELPDAVKEVFGKAGQACIKNA